MCPNKEKILKTKKINGRSVSVIYDCFQTVIYGRFETANIWLNKTGCVLLEAYMDVPKRLHMSVSTLPYVDVPTHLHTFVLERRGRSETPSDNCFYTPRIWQPTGAVMIFTYFSDYISESISECFGLKSKIKPISFFPPTPSVTRGPILSIWDHGGPYRTPQTAVNTPKTTLFPQ